MIYIFYSYLYLREDGTPYYVGKGTLDRALHGRHFVPIPPKERILLEPHTTEFEAFEAEKFLIDYYGRKDLGTGCLLNLTNGGEGTSGLKLSEETKKRISEASKGRNHSEVTKQKIGKAAKLRNTGRILSLEHRKRLSEAAKVQWLNSHNNPNMKKKKRINL